MFGNNVFAWKGSQLCDRADMFTIYRDRKWPTMRLHSATNTQLHSARWVYELCVHVCYRLVNRLATWVCVCAIRIRCIYLFRCVYRQERRRKCESMRDLRVVEIVCVFLTPEGIIVLKSRLYVLLTPLCLSGRNCIDGERERMRKSKHGREVFSVASFSRSR